MVRRKSFGNPLSKTLGKVIDKVAPEVFESAMDIATGPSKTRNDDSSSSSAARSTDWATRVPGTPRTRKR